MALIPLGWILIPRQKETCGRAWVARSGDSCHNVEDVNKGWLALSMDTKGVGGQRSSRPGRELALFRHRVFGYLVAVILRPKCENAVARKRQPHERKLRTRAHVLADLSINHVERQILLRGFALNRLDTDYGIDLLMLTYNDHGEVENGHVLFQVKATDSLQVLQQGTSIACRVEAADLKSWQDEWLPVILVVYDGQRNKAYWLYVRSTLKRRT